MLPLINEEVFNDEKLYKAVYNHFHNYKIPATDMRDVELRKCLKKYNNDIDSEVAHDLINLNHINLNAKFLFKGKTFKRGKLRRTRYEITSIDDNIVYTLSYRALVKPIYD